MLLTGFSESRVMSDKKYALKAFNAMLEKHKAKPNNDYNYKLLPETYESLGIRPYIYDDTKHFYKY